MLMHVAYTSLLTYKVSMCNNQKHVVNYKVIKQHKYYFYFLEASLNL